MRDHQAGGTATVQKDRPSRTGPEGPAQQDQAEETALAGEPGVLCPQAEASSKQGEDQDDDENRSENTHKFILFV